MSAAQRLTSLLSRNQEYASTYTAPPPLSAVRQRASTAPGGSIVILSCSDPRVVPAQYFKLGPGGKTLSIPLYDNDKTKMRQKEQ